MKKCDIATGTVIGLGTFGVGTYSAISSYQAARAQASAEEQAAKAQAQQLNAQARTANAQAGIEQVKAEEEAAKRSRLLSAEIGSSYANWAGNGLSVGGDGDDTFGNILKTQVAEGIQDVDTIKDNGAVNVWSYQSQANAFRAGAVNALIAGQNKADALRFSGTTQLVTGIVGGVLNGAATGLSVGTSVKKIGG